MTTGYIYVIKNEVGGLGGFKIGQTINPPRRFRELKLGTKSSLVGLWRSDKYASIERFLHKTFKHLRVPQSEWFALTPNVLQDVISRLNRCSTCIKLEDEYKPAHPVILKPTEDVFTSSVFNVSDLVASKPHVSAPVISKKEPEAWLTLSLILFCAVPFIGWSIGFGNLFNTDLPLPYRLISIFVTALSLAIYFG